MWKLVRRAEPRDGPGLSGADPRRGADHRDAEARGDALSQDAGARAVDPRGRNQVAQAGRPAQGRDRVHALRHLRLPARPHPGCAAAARHRRRCRRRSTRRWRSRRPRRAPRGRAPAMLRHRPSWFPIREKVGATEFLGYETETAEGVVTALVRDGKEVRRTQGRRDRRRDRQPDAVLRRIRRPGRRHRRHEGRRRALCRERHAEGGRRPVRAPRQGRAGHAQARHGAGARRRSRPPLGDPPQPFGDASAARGAAPGAGRSRRAEGLAGRARPAALRLLASEADDGRRDSRGSRISPTNMCCRIPRSPHA